MTAGSIIPLLDRGSDVHVHSTFSDGASTVEENVASAVGYGMHTLGLVDHVRRDSTYLPEFAAAVRALDGTAGLKVLLGVEAKILDTEGTMDLPDEMPSLDYVLVADHQVPRPDGPMHPRVAAELMGTGELAADEVIADLVEATVNAFDCYDRIVVAHMFSILPKMGLDEDRVPEKLVRRIADAARAKNVIIEVNEKWSCPSVRVATILADRGVSLTLSTDAHHETRVGRYSYVDQVATQLTEHLLAPSE